MSKATEYFENLQRIIARISTEQAGNIELAARAVADTLENGGRIHTFGTGHSHMLAEEIFYRAGGLVNVNPILETGLMLHESASKSTALERLEGYGEILFDLHGIKETDILFLFSNSGRNGVAIDLGIIAREKGVKTVVITNMEHTMQGKSRHSSGKKLYELGTVVIDNCGCMGDASMRIDEIGRNVAPTSTAAGAAILNAIEARAVEMMVADGYIPEVFSSRNVDGGDEINDAYVKKYIKEIKSL
ncbi:MAG: SIS domain-containing protein [Acutalibacteraceae bacterium]|nr:SIS domain-containing protein [Acutalibacteraceae bacterium]